MSRFPSRVSKAAPPLPHPHVRSPMASRTFASSHSTNGTSSTLKPRSWHCRRTTRQTNSPIRTPLPCRHICHRVDRQRCASTRYCPPRAARPKPSRKLAKSRPVHRVRIIWRHSRSKTSSSMRHRAFWRKDASCALCSTIRAKPTRSPLPWPLSPRRPQRQNRARPPSFLLPWTKRSLRLIFRRRFPASAAISSRAGCPHSPFCSISLLPGTCCLAEDTNQPAI